MSRLSTISRSGAAVSVATLVTITVLAGSGTQSSASALSASAQATAGAGSKSESVQLRAPAGVVTFTRPIISVKAHAGRDRVRDLYGRGRNGKPAAPSTPPSTSPSASASGGASSSWRPDGMLVPFGPSSIYTRSVRNAPLAGNSGTVVNQLVKDARKAVGVNFKEWTTPIYYADSSTPRKSVRWSNCQNQAGWEGKVPDQIQGPFTDVPMPSDVQASPDGDMQVAIYDRSSDRLWEFWAFKRNGDTYEACWGGRIDNVKQSDGIFAERTGASATSLSLMGTTISKAEVRAGKINHAVGVAVPTSAFGKFSFPATRGDGYSKLPNVPTPGQRFRLDPSVDVSSLKTTPLGRMVAEAAQEYGMIITNTAGAVTISMESSLPDTAAGKPDPWPGILAEHSSAPDVPGSQWNQMAGFPWDKLQAIQLDWR